MRSALPVVLALLMSSLGIGADAADKPAPAESASWEARLTGFHGAVMVLASGKKEEGLPASKGIPLEEGDVIRTGADSGAEIVFEGSSLLVLLPDSELILSSSRKEDTEVRLSRGGLLARVHSSLRGLRVSTPNTVAEVRGTDFGVIFRLEDGAETRVGIFDDGQIVVSNPAAGGSETLRGNQETLVRGAERPLPTYVLNRMKEHRKFVRDMKRRLASLGKKWKPLPREERLKLRAAWMEEALAAKAEKAKKAAAKTKPRPKAAAQTRADREEMEERRRRAIQRSKGL